MSPTTYSPFQIAFDLGRQLTAAVKRSPALRRERPLARKLDAARKNAVAIGFRRYART